MENIDSDLLLTYYFKDGYLFFVPDRLLMNTLDSDLYDQFVKLDDPLEVSDDV